jgi:hypothetical protein
MSKFTSFARAGLVVLSLGVAMTIAPANAGADVADDGYLAALARAGIPQIAPDRAIAAAKAVCLNLDQGATPDQLLASFVAKHVFASEAQDRAMIIASMTSYCPQYAPLLHA